MKKRLLPLLAFSALGLALSLPRFSVSAEGELPSTLSVGDTLNLPSKSMSYNGESKSAEILILSPSGATYTGNSLTIEEAGVYTITYRAFFGDHEEKETHTIRVDYTPCDLFKANDAVALKRGSFSYDGSLSGVKATFKNSGLLTFAKPLSLNKLGVATPLVSFIIDPSAKGTADFATFNINIVDAYNENNYVTINCVDSGTINTGGEAMYIKAGAVDQILYGYETDTNRHSDPSFGASIRSSFRAISSSGEYHTADFYLDNSALDVYGYPNFLASGKKRKIVGLSSQADHPTDPFAGFTSDLVYLTFEAKSFSSASGDVVFTSVGGMDLSADLFSDSDAPKISLDLAGNTDVPDAVLGRPYPLFEASSFDEFDGDVETQCNVYFLPGDGRKIDVSVDSSQFTPAYVGDYEIRYSSHDRFLNESQESLFVHCGKSSYPLLGTLPYYKTEATAYSAVSLPSLEDFSVSGGSGVIKKSRILIEPNGQLSPLSEDTFTPKDTGAYTIRYQAFDYLNQAVVCDLKVTVNNLVGPIFLGQINLPVAFVSGEETTLPLVEAKMPGETSPVDCPVEVYVNGEKLQGNAFTPEGSSVDIAYVASSERKEYAVPVVDLAQGQKQENILYGKGEATLSENAVTFKASEDGEVHSLRSLKPSELILKFGLPDFVDGDKVGVKLDDGCGAITLFVEKSDGGYKLSSSSRAGVGLTLDGDGDVYLRYDASTKQISDGSGLSVMAIGQTDDGSSFNGFSNGLRLSFLLEEGKSVALSKINNQTFGNRGRDIPQDEIGPEISLPSLPAVKQKVGSSVVLPKAEAYDVLNAVSTFVLTVVKPDKTKVELDPTLDNTLTFDQYGSYRLEYLATDAKGNSSKTIRLFNAYESNSPTLTLTSSLKESYGVGEEIALPAYTVTDDSQSYVVTMTLLTPDYERVVLLKDDSGAITHYLDKDDYSSYRVSSSSFKLSKEGHYSLLVIARDQFYNVSEKRVEFNVKGAN